MELAIKIWNEHIEVFNSLDLVCYNGHSLEEETKSTALFSALVTLQKMCEYNDFQLEELQGCIEYLKGSKYYSEANGDSDY